MMKLVAVIISAAIILIASSASALDLENFNDYTAVFGASEIDLSAADTVGLYSQIEQDDCEIIFKAYEDEKLSDRVQFIFITGTGDNFLAYSAAAILHYAPNGDKTNDLGQLIISYLLARDNSGPHKGKISSGDYFSIEKQEDGKFLFMIGE